LLSPPPLLPPPPLLSPPPLLPPPPLSPPPYLAGNQISIIGEFQAMMHRTLVTKEKSQPSQAYARRRWPIFSQSCRAPTEPLQLASLQDEPPSPPLLFLADGQLDTPLVV
jgi:hypothetical protein